MHEPGGVLVTVNAAPVPTEDTAGVELASAAEGAATAKPEALEPRAGNEAGRGRNMAPQNDAAEGTWENECVHEALPPEAPLARNMAR
jgi:hypothetical protein